MALWGQSRGDRIPKILSSTLHNGPIFKEIRNNVETNSVLRLANSRSRAVMADLYAYPLTEPHDA